MKANELRIGNYLMSNGFEVQIDCIQPTMLAKVGENFYTKIDLFEPIPLTEEWLLKFGFNEHRTSDVWFAKEWGTNGVEIIKYDIHYEKYIYLLGAGLAKVLEHVHQLQNLYFALTGHELEIKL